MMMSTHKNINIPQRNALPTDIYTASISNSIFSNSPNSTLEYDEDEKMAKLLRKVDSAEDLNDTEDISERMCESIDESHDQLTLPIDNAQERMQESLDEATPENAIGNSLLSGRNSWSEPAPLTAKESSTTEVEEEEAGSSAEIVFRRTASTRSTAAIDKNSFESLWNEKKKRSTTNFKEVWERFQKSLDTNIPQNNDIPEEDSDNLEDFEIIKSPLSDRQKFDELQQMVEILCRLSTEQGLDNQGFLCKECKSPLIDISKASVCGFDGFYYCFSCISKDKYAIPAKIIYNWDFSQKFVSQKAADFISDYQFKPFIDFKVKFRKFKQF